MDDIIVFFVKVKNEVRFKMKKILVIGLFNFRTL